jgi:tyrosinase
MKMDHSHAQMTFADADKVAKERLKPFLRPELRNRLSSSIRESDVLRQLLRELFTHPRKNQNSLTQAEKDAFNGAIQSLIADGTYPNLVTIHADMTHNMHGSQGFTGAMRFLPWHRVYLVKLEQAMQMYAPDARIPYWDWANDHTLPAWVVLPVGVTRGPDHHYALPSQADINNTVLSQSDYIGFTEALESYHNTVHMFVGGNTMPYVSVSPHDPMFWLHHANVDRIWAQWQQTHSGVLEPLIGSDAVMDPWPQNITETNDIGNFYYNYA